MTQRPAGPPARRSQARNTTHASNRTCSPASPSAPGSSAVPGPAQRSAPSSRARYPRSGSRPGPAGPGPGCAGTPPRTPWPRPPRPPAHTRPRDPHPGSPAACAPHPPMPGTDQKSAGCPGIRGQCVNAKSDQRARGNRKRPSGSGPQRQAFQRALIPKKPGVTGSPRHHPANRNARQAPHPSRDKPSRLRRCRLAPDFLANAGVPGG